MYTPLFFFLQVTDVVCDFQRRVIAKKSHLAKTSGYKKQLTDFVRLVGDFVIVTLTSHLALYNASMWICNGTKNQPYQQQTEMNTPESINKGVSFFAKLLHF